MYALDYAVNLLRGFSSIFRKRADLLYQSKVFLSWTYLSTKYSILNFIVFQTQQKELDWKVYILTTRYQFSKSVQFKLSYVNRFNSLFFWNDTIDHEIFEEKQRTIR